MQDVVPPETHPLRNQRHELDFPLCHAHLFDAGFLLLSRQRGEPQVFRRNVIEKLNRVSDVVPDTRSAARHGNQALFLDAVSVLPALNERQPVQDLKTHLTRPRAQ